LKSPGQTSEGGVKWLFTSDRDLDANIHQSEERKQMDTLEGKNLAEVAVVASVLFSRCLADESKTFFTHGVNNPRSKDPQETLTVLGSESECQNQNANIEDRQAERDEIVKGPVFRLRKVGGNEGGR
jgi:hypothetical protein